MNASEFIRNELLFKDIWIAGFQDLGLSFPSAPINGMAWMAWSFILCAIIAILIDSFSLLKTTVIVWVTGFIMMWIVLINLGVFPTKLLTWAVPWSFAEVYVAAFIAKKYLKT